MVMVLDAKLAGAIGHIVAQDNMKRNKPLY